MDQTPQPVKISNKKYFLLALLVAGVSVVVILLGLSLLKSFVGAKYPTYPGSIATTGIVSPGLSRNSYGFGSTELDSKVAQDMIYPAPPVPGEAPVTNVAPEDRKVIKNGSVSTVVKNVDQAVRDIEAKAKELGGYLSATNLSTSGTNTKSGYVSARIPVDKVNDFLTYLRSSSVKVTNESINSDDVTSQYIDLQAKITNLEATAAQYRELLRRAVKIDEVLQVQRELNNVQSQIDSYKGQLKYLEGNSALSNITVYLALDADELPATPETRWQPGAVFKSALRALTIFAQNLSYLAIGVAVFAPVWLPVLVGLYFLYKFLRKKLA